MPITRRGFQATLALTALAGIYGRSRSAVAQQVRRGGRLVWGIETEPVTLNPHLNGQAKARLVLRNIFESLLARTENGEYVPWLASGYDVSGDNLIYTFTLREGIRFSDGKVLDAEAVAANFNQIRDPGYSRSLSTGPAARLKEVTVLDTGRIRFTLSEAYAPFLNFAAGLELVSPASFASGELKSGGKEVAGTGPFIIESHVRGQELRLVRNPDYNWAPAHAPQQGPALLDEVVYRFLPEAAVRTGALTSGQVDVIEGISGNDVSLFRDDSAYRYQSALNTGTPYTLFLNVENGPTQDVLVRRALLASVDVEAVIRSVYRGERTRAWGIASPVTGDFHDASIGKSYGFNPAEANRLLDEAGWTARDSAGFRTKDGARLTIEVVQAQATVRDQRDVLLLAAQAQAKQHAGIDLAIVYVDSGTYTERRNKGDFGSIPNSRTPADDGVDIEYHYLPVTAGGSINYSRVSDPKVSDWLRAAAATSDRRERAAIYGRLERYALEEALVLPLYVPEDQIASAAHVEGVRFRPFFQQPESAYGVWLNR